MKSKHEQIDKIIKIKLYSEKESLKKYFQSFQALQQNQFQTQTLINTCLYNQQNLAKVNMISSYENSIDLPQVMGKRLIDEIQCNDSIDFNNIDIQDIEAEILKLSEAFDPWEYEQSDQESQINSNYQRLQSQHLIHSLRFKELFLDQLEGEYHELYYIGSISQQKTRELKAILSLFASILFRISEQEKMFYPHLLTHIKEQFYKPNIFENLHLAESMKQKYCQLIDCFFHEAQQNQNFTYEEFLKYNPEFQELCIIILNKIAFEESKRPSLESQTKEKLVKTFSFEIIENLCSKFLIELSVFGFGQPSIEIIALANQERFIFVNEESNLFFVCLEKFQLLSVRRKSSHNISVNEKTQKQLKRNSSSKQIKPKKNSWQSHNVAHFGTEKPQQYMDPPALVQRDLLILNVIDSDSTSNYQSSVFKTQSKVNEVSDQSTPKFKNSEIARIRKKSHKDSFGGVDFDNMVYKDLSNPKKFVQKKGIRNKDQTKNHILNVENMNKKVFSERFQTNDVGSLTYGDDEQSQIQFVPHFQMKQQNYDQKARNVSIHGNDPASPAYSAGNYFSFSNFINENKFEDKQWMIKKMKGSNIEKSPEFFYEQLQPQQDSPKLKQKNSNGHGNLLRQNHSGHRLLASSQIIEFTGSLEQSATFRVEEKNQPLSNFPSLASEFQCLIEQKFQSKSLSLLPHKDFFMSFSKNDKQRFIITDSQQIEVLDQSMNEHLTQSLRKEDSKQNKDNTNSQIEESNKTRDRKYSFRTQKEDREKFRKKQQQDVKECAVSMANKSQMSVTQNINTQILKHNKYNRHDQNSQIGFRQFQNSASEVNLKNSYTFVNEIIEKNSRLQRKHSSNVPIYKAVEIGVPQEKKNIGQNFEMNLANTKNAIAKKFDQRFQQNSVRFSQVMDNTHDEIFYIENKNSPKEGFTNTNRKQRKVTDFYESPLVKMTNGGNRTSQMIEMAGNFHNSYNIETSSHYPKDNKFSGHLDISGQDTNMLVNSGGGKNYSVISNISYDEEKRLEDLMEIENKLFGFGMNHQHQNVNYEGNEVDFANFQAVQKLIFKKKQQKNKLSSTQINVSIRGFETTKEPQDWVKKEVFYFFESKPNFARPPEKQVIYNTQRKRKTSIVRQGESRNQLPSSSISLYNFSTRKLQNPEHDIEKQTSIENKSLQRKYSAQQLKIVSEQKFTYPKQMQSQRSIQNYMTQPSLASYYSPHKNLNNQSEVNYRITEREQFIHPPSSLKSHMSNVSIVNRTSPPKIIQSNQVLRTYPSQPVIKFTIGNTGSSVPQTFSPQPQIIRPVLAQQPYSPFAKNVTHEPKRYF